MKYEEQEHEPIYKDFLPRRRELEDEEPVVFTDISRETVAKILAELKRRTDK